MTKERRIIPPGSIVKKRVTWVTDDVADDAIGLVIGWDPVRALAYVMWTGSKINFKLHAPGVIEVV